MWNNKLVFLISVLLAFTVTLTQGIVAEENKIHNVDIVFGSSSVENGMFYNPPVVKIMINDSVNWINFDKNPHIVTGGTLESKWGNVFDSGLMRKGEEFKFTFTKVGEYPYLCALHPFIIGKVFVEDPISNNISSNVNILQN